MDAEKVAEEWAGMLGGNKPLRRMVYYEVLKDVFTQGTVRVNDVAERLYHNRRHATVRKVRRYIKELVDKNIIQKRRRGFGGAWYYEPTDWFRALMIETYKILKRIM